MMGKETKWAVGRIAEREQKITRQPCNGKGSPYHSPCTSSVIVFVRDIGRGRDMVKQWMTTGDQREIVMPGRDIESPRRRVRICAARGCGDVQLRRCQVIGGVIGSLKLAIRLKVHRRLAWNRTEVRKQSSGTAPVSRSYVR